MKLALLTFLLIASATALAASDDPSICKPDGTLCVTHSQEGFPFSVVLQQARLGENCSSQSLAYDRRQGIVLSCHGKWQKASKQELQILANSNNARMLTPSESKTAMFAEARPITLIEGALAKDNGCLYVVRKTNSKKDWLLTQVSCNQDK